MSLSYFPMIKEQKDSEGMNTELWKSHKLPPNDALAARYSQDVFNAS